MKVVSGFYFDGQTARGTPAQLTLNHPQGVVLEIEQSEPMIQPAEAIQCSPRIGSSPRFVTFASGAKFETRDNDAMDLFLAQQGRERRSRLAHFLERDWFVVLVATLFTFGFGYVVIVYGAPMGAKLVASTIPPEWERQLGKEGLASLERMNVLIPSQLSLQQQAHIQEQFKQVTAHLSAATFPDLRLELRHSEVLGANALALPAGIVIITDGLVELVEDDRELIAVMAHELGHIVARHGLRRILQDSAVAVTMNILIGDASSLATMAASLPIFMIEMQYSRTFEHEADQYARDFLCRLEMSPAWLSSLLEKIENNEEDMEIPAYLSSHPNLQARKTQRFCL